MKFSLPNRNPKQGLLRGLTTIKHTWEYRLATAGTAASVIIGAACILFFRSRLPPAVPLWYSRPWGEDRLASPLFLFVPLGATIVIYVINILVISYIGSNHPMFARVLLLTSLLVSALSVVVIFRVVDLVL